VLFNTLAIGHSILECRNLLSNPRKSAQDRNDDEDIRNDTADNDSRMLDGAIPDDIHDLVDQPSTGLISYVNIYVVMLLTQHQRERIRNEYLRHAVEWKLPLA
jgi:hypothetical protein